MKKIILFCLLGLLTFSNIVFAEGIGGFWKSVSDKSGKPECMLAVYQYEDKWYGRIIGTYGANGEIVDSIYHPKGRAPGVKGNPFYCGLDIVWNLRRAESVYKGKILDPRKGNVYNAKVWVKNGTLIVRGELLFFGRNKEWFPTSDEDFSADFQKPDLAKFVPVIPEGK